MKHCFFTLFACICMTIGVYAQNSLLVCTHIESGDIEGVVEDSVAIYKAIPYAAPPVGNLRWKAPQPVKPWNGVKKMTAYGPWPPQLSRREGKVKMSEDCLYLSVTTPARSTGEHLPVMVWIHGGGFQTEWYGATNWSNLAKCGLVIVNIEYRTGAIGFMAHPELTKENPNKHSGNYGLLDQIYALQWVQRNISQFGGDPSKVTIFGESAGAISVSILCASPLAKGLFRAAICQSGANFYPTADKRVWHVTNHTMKGAEQQGLEFQKHLKAKSLKELRKIPANQLVGDSVGFYGFWPCVDDYVIVGDQRKLYDEGKYNDVPVILMSNSDEGVMFTQEWEPKDYEKFIREKYTFAADSVLALYPGQTRLETYDSFSDIWRDAAYGWPEYAWATRQSKTGKSPVYTAYLSQWTRTSYVGSRRRRGVSHVDELFYLNNKFSHLNRKGKFNVEEYLGRIMQDYWVNFAKTGNPNALGLPYWTPFEEGKPTTMEFNRGAHLIDVPNKLYIDFWDHFFSNWK